MSSTLLTILIIAVFLVVILTIKKKDKSSPLGINLKRTYCPNCNEKQPFIRTPKTAEQALIGGNICKKCGTKMDKYGTKI